MTIGGFDLSAPIGGGGMSVDASGNTLFINRGDLDFLSQATTSEYGAPLRASNITDLTPNGGLHGKLTSVTSVLGTVNGCGLVAVVGVQLHPTSYGLFARSSASSSCRFDRTSISSQTFTEVGTTVPQPILGLSADTLGNIFAVIGSSIGQGVSGSL
jgi:hypothetical protein